MNKTKRSWLQFRTLRALTKRLQRRRARKPGKAHEKGLTKTKALPGPTRQMFRQHAFHKPMTILNKR